MPTDATIGRRPPEAVPRPSSDSSRGSLGKWNAFRGLPAWYRALRWVVRRVVWRLRGLEYALLPVERELSSTVKVAWWRKPGLWWRGFLSESFVLYDLGNNRWSDYLTDLDRSVSVRRINRDYGVILDDKLVFERLMADGDVPRPNLFGLLNGSVVEPFRSDPRGRVQELLDLLYSVGSLVLKPVRGGGGRGVSVVHALEGDDLLLNGRRASSSELWEHITGNDTMLVYECVRQHKALSRLYPHSLNTIRILTMTGRDGVPFVARAVLRLGTDASCPTDNWIRGGLCTAINLEDGSLGQAVRFPARDDRLRWVSVHPDTDAPIAGSRIPEWDAVLAAALKGARTVPSTPYVGWDVALSEEGPVMIEGNSYSGVNLFQVHEPLLNDPDIRGFFEQQGVVQKKKQKK